MDVDAGLPPARAGSSEAADSRRMIRGGRSGHLIWPERPLPTVGETSQKSDILLSRFKSLLGDILKKAMALPFAAAALMLTACGGEAQSAPVETATHTPTPTPTVQTATVQQYGEIMLESRKGVDEFLEDWEDENCSGLGIADGDLLCNMTMMRAPMVASIVDLNFSAAAKPTAPGFIGAPPAELEGIVADTREAAQASIEAGEEWKEANCPDGDQCAFAAGRLEDAVEDLQLKFDAWQLYLP